MAKKSKKTIELENQLKRALADYDNLRKRFEKESKNLVKFANEVLLLKILGIVDGLELTLKQFKNVLKSEGLEEITVEIGEKFNPEFMEAVEKQGKGDKVLAIVQKGYRLHDKVVRPARVRVGSKNE